MTMIFLIKYTYLPPPISVKCNPILLVIQAQNSGVIPDPSLSPAGSSDPSMKSKALNLNQNISRT